MLDFRKVLLALSVASLGLVGTASAQTPVCTTLAPQPFEGSIAQEGTTEALPTALISCNGQSVTGTLIVTLTASAPFTNQTLPHSTSIDATATDNGGDTGTVTQVGAATIQISFASVTGVLNSITVLDLRVNPSGSPLLSQVSLTLGSPSIPVTAPAANFAYVQKTLSSVTINAAPVVNTSACSLLPATISPVANVVLTNGFPGSLKVRPEIQNGSAIAATQGTTFAVTFSNLNPGVNYYVQTPLTAGSLTLTAYTSAAATTVATPGVNGLLLAAVNGSATVYYQVTADSQTGTETATIALTEVVPSVAGVTSYSSAPVAVSIVLASAGTGYPGYSSSQTAYTATQTASNTGNGLLTPCSTTLLFPYVVNTAGYDTGIAIANASTGITGVPSVTPTSGACAVTFYSGSGTPVVYNTGVIASGTDGTPFTVSAAAPGIAGYAVAVCNFQGAHGYAFITDGFGGGGAGLSADYLAVVVANQYLGATGTVAF